MEFRMNASFARIFQLTIFTLQQILLYFERVSFAKIPEYGFGREDTAADVVSEMLTNCRL